MEYVNKTKLALAEDEAARTSGDVTAIYLRLGGKLIGDDVPVEEEPKKKTRKKA